MAEKAPGGIRFDDFVGNVVPDPANPQATSVLSGFVGKSDAPGRVRIYPDVSFNTWHDVAESDIVHSYPLPPESSALGGSYVWVKAQADVRPGSAAAGAGGAPAAQAAGAFPATHVALCRRTVYTCDDSNCPAFPTEFGHTCPICINPTQSGCTYFPCRVGGGFGQAPFGGAAGPQAAAAQAAGAFPATHAVLCRRTVYTCDDSNCPAFPTEFGHTCPICIHPTQAGCTYYPCGVGGGFGQAAFGAAQQTVPHCQVTAGAPNCPQTFVGHTCGFYGCPTLSAQTCPGRGCTQDIQCVGQPGGGAYTRTGVFCPYGG